MYHVRTRGIYRRLGHDLTYERRAQTRLTKLHHRIAQLAVLRYQRTDTYSALRVTFRHRIYQYDILLDPLQMAGRNIGRARIYELAVDLVREEEQIILFDHVAYAVHLLARV